VLYPLSYEGVDGDLRQDAGYQRVTGVRGPRA
jgi:hypothetical protein